MLRQIQVWMMAALLSGVASAALAQEMDTALLKYDVEMATALRMNNSTWVLPPGDYRLEQVDDAAATLFLLRQKKPDGTYSEPVAILDAWRVPYQLQGRARQRAAPADQHRRRGGSGHHGLADPFGSLAPARRGAPTKSSSRSSDSEGASGRPAPSSRASPRLCARWLARWRATPASTSWR